MTNEPPEQGRSQNNRDLALLIASIVISGLMLASLWLFVTNPHHRIGGVAVNGLLQAFAPLFAFIGAFWFFVNAVRGAMYRLFGFVAAIVLAASAVYCFYRAWPILMSV